MAEPDAAERNYILRKDAAGVPPKEIADGLDREDAMETVESVLAAEWYGAYRLDDASPVEQYEVLLRAVYGIESGYFTSIAQQPFSRLLSFTTVNAALPALVIALVLAPFMSEIAAGPLPAVTGPALPFLGVTAALLGWTAVTAGVGTVLVHLFGGRDPRTTVKLFLSLSAFYTAYWIPVLNAFALLYSGIATVRGIEIAHGLDFPRALAVTVLTPLTPVIVLAAL